MKKEQNQEPAPELDSESDPETQPELDPQPEPQLDPKPELDSIILSDSDTGNESKENYINSSVHPMLVQVLVDSQLLNEQLLNLIMSDQRYITQISCTPPW